jgi:hypothetical protein
MSWGGLRKATKELSIDSNRSALCGSAAVQIEISLLKPSATVPYVSAGLARKDATFCTHFVFWNVVWIAEQTAVWSLSLHRERRRRMGLVRGITFIVITGRGDKKTFYCCGSSQTVPARPFGEGKL